MTRRSWFSFLRRGRAPRREPARPTSDVLAQVPHGWRVLAGVPYDDDGRHWLLACREGLVCVGEDGPLPQVSGWDRVTRASWDGQERCLTVQLLGRRPVVLTVPALLRRTWEDGRSRAFEVRDEELAPVLRQQVEAAIVHYVRRTLSTGERVTVSARRRADGEVYVVAERDGSLRLLGDLEGGAEDGLVVGRVPEGAGQPGAEPVGPGADPGADPVVESEVRRLVEQLRLDVGLPTR